jgi:hypothetical protein
MDGITSEHADLRQCAVYGIGVLAAKAPAEFRPHVIDALNRIRTVVSAPDAKSE